MSICGRTRALGSGLLIMTHVGLPFYCDHGSEFCPALLNVGFSPPGFIEGGCLCDGCRPVQRQAGQRCPVDEDASGNDEILCRTLRWDLPLHIWCRSADGGVWSRQAQQHNIPSIPPRSSNIGNVCSVCSQHRASLKDISVYFVHATVGGNTRTRSIQLVNECSVNG